MRKLVIGLFLLTFLVSGSLSLFAKDDPCEFMCQLLVYGCTGDGIKDAIAGNEFEKSANENSYLITSQETQYAIFKEPCKVMYQQGWNMGKEAKSVGIKSSEDSFIKQQLYQIYNHCMKKQCGR